MADNGTRDGLEDVQPRSLDDATLDGYLAELDATRPESTAIEVRSESLREIGMRIVPWDRPVVTRDGPEVILRGAFEGTDPSTVVLRLEHENPPAGKGISYEDRADGAWMVFRASTTQRGDDILTLARDGVTTGVSVGFEDVPGGTQVHRRGGRLLRVVSQARLREVSTTWRPTWREAAIQFVRSAEGEPAVAEVAPVPETPAAPVINVDTSAIAEIVGQMSTALTAQTATLADMRAAMLERSRGDFVITGPQPKADVPKVGDWMSTVLRMMTGERIPEQHLRALDELITTDNIGVVPPAYSSELIGIINAQRPFLNSTRRLNLPSNGMSLILPKIVTRPETGVQVAEKDPIASNTTSITTATYTPVTLAGGGDLSLQLLKRSDPSFLDLYIQLLAESLSQNAETQAITALLAASGVNNGGTLDPEDALFGDAWANTYGALQTGPDTIWMSSHAVGSFIDAKANTTNTPLYGQLVADFSAAGGIGGTISGLRPVHVPALNPTAVDVIIGNSRGFAWGEDGAYTLQVDVPSLAGRDVALVSIFFFAPLYPAAFTKYAVAGS